MNLQEYIGNIIDKPSLWKYYDVDIATPNLSDSKSCSAFIKDYTILAKKFCTFVQNGLDYLEEHDENRLKHIADTYFLGEALFHDSRLDFGKLIVNCLSKYKVFQGKNKSEISKEFNFVWFMITLYHDLGYIFEDGHYPIDEILRYTIPNLKPNSIPRRYVKVYRYYLNEHNNDRGICGGLEFDRDICGIRREMSTIDRSLSWDERLEEVYHDVSWIIIAHNMWLRRRDGSDGAPYEGVLKCLNIPAEKSEDDSYRSYPINIRRYPLFTLFSLIDTIEPQKRGYSLDKIDIEIFRNHIYLNILEQKTDYICGVVDANKWLLPIKLLFGHIIDIECRKSNLWSLLQTN